MKRYRAFAVFLAVVLLLTGCAAVDNGREATNGTEETGGIGSVVQKDKPVEPQQQQQGVQLQAGIVLSDGILFGENDELTEAETQELSELFAEHERYLMAVPPSGERVKDRDWSRYTCEDVKRGMNAAQAELYDRLDEVCYTYLMNPGHYVTSGNYNYISQAVRYSDLDISLEEACELFYWFKFNNPHYYFVDWLRASKTHLFVTVDDFAVSLTDEAKVTNEMFDKLDSWIAECCDDEVTTLDKIRAANKKICENTLYSPAVRKGDDSAAGGPNQTIYSVLMTPETVCAGYARTFQAIANAIGVDTYTLLSHNHAWNAARFDDGNYYIVDVCWNDEDVGFNESYLGVGTDYVTANDYNDAHVFREGIANLYPDIPADDYDGETLTAPVPSPHVTGSGPSVVKVEWEPVANAQNYEYFVFYGSEQLVGLRIAADETFAYVSFPQGVNALTVLVRSVVSVNGMRVTSELAQLGVSTDASGESLVKPTNIVADNSDGVTLRWDDADGVDGWLIIGFNDDSTFVKPWIKCRYSDPAIGWTNAWQPEQDTYFQIMSIKVSGDSEIYSAPVSFKYNIHDGMTLIDTTGAGSGASEDDETVTITYSDGGVYVGQVKDGKRDGYGVYTFPSGNVYEGEWKDGKMDGYVKHTWASDGSFYEGEWKNGERSGHGTYTWANGDVFEGEWLNSERNGHGTYTWANGTVQEGEWKDNEFVDGSSTTTKTETKTYSNGTYTGEMKDGNPDGYGRMEYFNGNVYEGEWKDGQISGYGTYTWAEGSSYQYEGQFVDSKRNGFGKYTWANGDVYIGGWKNNQADGHGKYTWADGTVRVGDWQEGEYGPTAELETKEYSNGVYTGELVNGVPNGFGKMEFNSGSVYDGQFVDGKITGYGKYTWPDGDVFEGEWKDGKKDGHGKYTWADGSVRVGVWSDGTFVG